MFNIKLKELINEFENGNISIQKLEKDIQELAKEEFYDQETQVAISWSIEDVKNDRPDLTDEECLDVLHVAIDEHDANNGINWDVLQYHTNRLYPLEEDMD